MTTELMPRRPRKQQPSLPKTRMQIGHEIKRERQTLGSLVIAIELARRDLFIQVDKAIEVAFRLPGTGSVVGSTVQVPQADPRQEQAIDFLESVRKQLRDLLDEVPW